MNFHLSPLFYKAVDHATWLHRSQVRKNPIPGVRPPYISHPFSVALLVLEYGGDEEQAIAALLHDVIEDQGHQITLDEIEELYGRRVRKLVESCTEVAGQDGVEKPDWKERKLKYLRHMAESEQDSMLISCADKLHNLRCMVMEYEKIGPQLWTVFKGSAAETLWFNQELSNIFTKKLNNPISAVFAAELEQFREMITRREALPAPKVA